MSKQYATIIPWGSSLELAQDSVGQVSNKCGLFSFVVEFDKGTSPSEIEGATVLKVISNDGKPSIGVDTMPDTMPPPVVLPMQAKPASPSKWRMIQS